MNRMDVEEVRKVVQSVIESGDFLFPGGVSPRDFIQGHTDLSSGLGRLESRHTELSEAMRSQISDMGKLLDVVVGPVATNWKGDLDPDGSRNEDLGLMAQMSNGGVPVQIPISIKAAIWTAAGSIVAAGVTGTAVLIGTRF